MVRFRATGSFAAGTNFTWDFGNGPRTGKDTILQVFTSPGKYTVKMTVTVGGSPCTITKTDTIVVRPSPTPSFTVTPARVTCNGTLPMTFTDNTAGIVSRKWTIDGVSDTARVVTKKFTSFGYKSVSLEVIDAAGCRGFFSDNKYLNLTDSVRVEFGGTITMTDVATELNLAPCVKAGLRTVASYDWSFPNGFPSSYSGQTPPTITYAPNTPPSDVTLTITMTDGCKYVATRKGYAMRYFKLGMDSLCVKKQFYITNLGNSNGRGFFNYMLRNAQVPPMGASAAGIMLSYNVAGYQDFEMTFMYDQNSSCSTTVIMKKYIKVLGPAVRFSVPDKNLCKLGDSLQLINESDPLGAPNVNYIWRVTDARNKTVFLSAPNKKKENAYFKPKDTGRYNVSLRAYSSNGCSDSAYLKQVILVVEMVADFTVEAPVICLGEDPKLKATPKPEEDKDATTKYTYSWSIQHADSTPWFTALTGKTPVWTPQWPGRYNITLKISNGKKCEVTVVKKMAVTVNGTYAAVKVDTAVGCGKPSFATRVSVDPQKIYTWPRTNSPRFRWRVDPMEDVVIQDTSAYNTLITFTNGSGCYTINATWETPGGCFVKVSKENAVCLGISNSFGIGEVRCLNDTVATYNKSDMNQAKAFRWEITPRAHARIWPNDTAKEPKIILLKDTCFKLRLTTIGTIRGKYCETTREQPICPELPKSIFSSNDTFSKCAPAVVSFSAENAKAKAYYWDFGDGQTLYGANPSPSHVYADNNVDGYTVKMIAFDSLGCSDTFTAKNYIKVIGPVPKFSVSQSSGCNEATITFRDESQATKSRLFIFDDGNYSDTARVATHRYVLDDPTKDSIVFRPYLIVEGTCSNKYFFQDEIVIYRPPAASFTADSTSGCIPFTASFDAGKSFNSTRYWWDFDGDGIYDDSTSSPVIKHKYNKEGTFAVTLKVANSGGCFDIMRLDSLIVARKKPVAAMKLSSRKFCDSGWVKFTDLSQYGENFVLDPGNGDGPYFDTLPPVNYVFDPGNPGAVNGFLLYTPTLRVFNAAGCESIYTDSVWVYKTPEAMFSADKTFGCPPLKTKFTYTGSGALTYEWDFNGDGITDATTQDAEFTFRPGIYSPSLKVTGMNGCTDRITMDSLIIVNTIPVVSFNVDDTVVCTFQPVAFTASATPDSTIVRWSWKFNDPAIQGDTANERNPVFRFATAGWKTVTLTTYDFFGCVSTSTRRVLYVEDTLPPVNTDLNYVSVNLAGEVEGSWANQHLNDFGHWSLYRNGNKLIGTVSDSTQTDFTDADPIINTSGASYCYSMTTTDRCDNLSAAGNSHCTILLKGSTPAKYAASLQWSAYKGWQPQAYRITRSTGGDNFVTIATIAGDTTVFADSGLCSGTYCYRIGALHPNGKWISFSNKVCLEILYDMPLATAARVATVINDKHVELRWDSSYAPARLKNYIIDRKKANGPWVNGYGITTQNVFKDFAVNPDKDVYTYRIREVDICGIAGPYSDESRTMLLKVTVNSNEGRELRWTPYGDWLNGVSNYRIQIRQRNGRWKELGIVDAGILHFTDNVVHTDIDTFWTYRVQAIEAEAEPDTSTSNEVDIILPSRIYVPTAFTPGNSDSLNNTWSAKSLFLFNKVKTEELNFKVQVYDRWGSQIWEATDINAEWDGHFSSGAPAPGGVYIYSISARGYDNNYFQKRGTITLIR